MIRVRSARPVDMPGVAAVLQDAFSEKMAVIFSRQPEKVRKLLESAYTPPVARGFDGVLVAERDGRIVGTLLIEPIHYTDQEMRAFESLGIRELGMLRMLRSAFLLWWMRHYPAPQEAYISDVGVAADCRRQGIGKLLMRHAENWARTHERTRLTLWVAATNSPAIRVYELSGYTITETRSSWVLKLAFGVRHWHFMEKSLSGSSPIKSPSSWPDEDV